ncbi:hypothetical protein C8R47DRAFT_1067864 [Mycena vitilis]|nr:hypothetical protein C8R47DRAFT_1067864 [Mycena vitilis]
MTRIAEQLNVAAPVEEEQPNDPHLRLRIEDGAFVIKDQMKEYTDRGRPLGNMSYIQYHVDTYDGARLRKKRGRRRESEEGTGDGEDEDDREGEPEDQIEEDPEDEMPEVEEPLPTMGRPPSERVEYLKASKRKGCRVIRNANLETLPQFIGTWFPRPDNDEYYCANILTLLKPWHDLGDLQAPDGTFRTTFDEFMLTAGVRERRIIQNINYFHECTDSAKENQSAPLELISGTADLHDDVRREMEQEEIDAWQVPLTEADVEIARNEKYDAREFLYGHGAMLVAESMGIFDDQHKGPLSGAVCDKATPAEALVYQKWGETLKTLSKKEALVTSNRTMPTPVARPWLGLDLPSFKPKATGHGPGTLPKGILKSA